MGSNRKISTVVFLLFALAAMAAGCILSSESGTKKKKEMPKILSLSISDGDVITTSDVGVSWTANTLAEFYRYTLDGREYGWIDTTAVNLTGLNESEHTFTVIARKDTLESDPVTVTFSVDAVQGPGIIVSPRKIEGISFVTVSLEDVTGIMAAHIELYCDDGSAWISDFTEAEPSDGGGEMVTISNDKNPQRLVIDVGFAGLTAGVDGRVEIGHFLVRPIKAEGFVYVDSLATEFRDVGNVPVEVLGFDRVRIER